VLTKPVPHTTTVNGSNVTSQLDIAVDEVTYGKGGRWPQWAAAVFGEPVQGDRHVGRPAADGARR